MLAAVPAGILEIPFGLSVFFGAVLAAPIIEESAKYLVVRLTVYKDVRFDQPLDGIEYAAAAALGFASIENLLYLLRSYWRASQAQDLSNIVSPFGVVATVFVVRALLSVPGHALFSSMWGYTLGKTKFAPAHHHKHLNRSGLELAMVLHGLFNLLLLSGVTGLLGVIILVPVMWHMLFHRIREATIESESIGSQGA
jgi:RsiW-degrading membrane proteinase PrsW (M82 family)